MSTVPKKTNDSKNSKPAKCCQQKRVNTCLFEKITRPFIPLLMFFLLFKLQRLVRENLHFERWNPTFCRAVIKKKHRSCRYSGWENECTGLANQIKSRRVVSHTKTLKSSRLVSVSLRLNAINAITITSLSPPPPLNLLFKKT